MENRGQKGGGGLAEAFEEKLNAILGNQEAMGQIMALARSLSGGPDSPPSPAGQAEAEAAPQTGTGAQAETPETPAGPPAPDLSALLEGVDPKLLQLGSQLFGEMGRADSRGAALLSALRPFLREERRARLDRALQIAQVLRLVRMTMEKGDEGRV